MGGLFGSSPKAPDTSAQEALAQKQEDRANRQTAEEQRKLAAQIAARRSGGYRSLLSPEREDAQQGLPTKLGA